MLQKNIEYPLEITKFGEEQKPLIRSCFPKHPPTEFRPASSVDSTRWLWELRGLGII